MANILILEDNMTRVKHFKKMFMRHTIYHFDDANKAIEELKKTDFGLICLDHDLGGKQMEWDEENCGMVVAKYLEQNPPKCDVIVHSYNTYRAKQMVDMIPNAIYIPGFWLHPTAL